MIAIVLSLSVARALDIGSKQQMTMLCNSAKKSGNTEYLDKCQCFYESNDIKCIK